MDPSQFASLHLDYEQNPAGTIILSFTVEPSDEVKKEIEALVADDPGDVAFRVVPYTEKELMEKQREIDHAVFEENVLEDKGISVYYTSPDIINSRVEVGISPFNEETVAVIHELFGDEMVEVVEGQQPQLLIGDDAIGNKEMAVVEDPVLQDALDDEVEIQIMSSDSELDVMDSGEEPGFFARIWNWFIGLFQ
ncbi:MULTISPECIES: hypothetical protein [Bacillaceae]|uniref:Uncharacterized protein n=1 Tax=Evansella alkalicola TaxID=745819 RepID=A0ABS6JP96_9BACI|nr:MULTISPECIES: hypothetical protein [Bacillaceae]MBU9720082.1 hypothetical protein [Bacillus alkalicola]